MLNEFHSCLLVHCEPRNVHHIQSCWYPNENEMKEGIHINSKVRLSYPKVIFFPLLFDSNPYVLQLKNYSSQPSVTDYIVFSCFFYIQNKIFL